VFTSRYLQPTDRYFDRTYKFVGSSIAEYYAENNLPLDQLKNRPVLSLSMGTAFNRPSDWYEQSVEAFGDMDIQVILSVGTQRQIGDFKRIPDNFIMTNAPQWAVLKHASAMISLGEINAIHSALIHSVPLVMIPVWGAQPLIANRVKRLGAGVVLDREKLTPSLLRESVEEVLNQPAYRVNAARIGETLREAGGVERAVEEIFALKKRLSGMTEPVGK
jgi:MGT family glycosyltransferase